MAKKIYSCQICRRPRSAGSGRFCRRCYKTLATLKKQLPIQTASEVAGTADHRSVEAALAAAAADPSIWRISFYLGPERIALMRRPGDRVFYLEPALLFAAAAGAVAAENPTEKGDPSV